MMNEHTLRTLEFDRILMELATYTQSGLGKKLVAELRPQTQARAVAQNLRETTEARAVLDAAGHVPLHGLADVGGHLERAIRGAVLDPEALLQTADFLRGARRTREFMRRYLEIAPMVAGYAQSITPLTDLEDLVELSIEDGRVSDAASTRLAKVRSRIEVVRGRIKDKMHSFLTTAKYRDCLQEAVISMKDDRYCLVIKSSHRHQVDGSVVASSGSGRSVFVEPAAVRALTDELKILLAEEQDEEYQVLSGLTGEIAARAREIGLNIETMAQYDLAFAKAKYGRSMDGIAAELVTGRRIRIRAGRHPMLGKGAVPLDFDLGGPHRTMLITGPNTGGKTVTLKTVGLFVLMTQAGLHVPAERGTALGLFDRVLVDIGDQQSIAQSLSTFSGHMKNIIGILGEAGAGSLVLIDEIGTGTDPAEGAALAMAILSDLHAAGALTVATTHYGDLKRFADQSRGFINACMDFDRETLQPLYRLLIGRAGRSNGLWIAARLGMRSETLAKAEGFIAPPDPPGVSPEAVSHEDMDDDYEDWTATEPLYPAPETPPPAITTEPAEETCGKAEADRPFRIGDSVHVGTLKENGILCALADDRGEVTVLVRGKRIKINQKRIKLNIPMEQLYPDHERYEMDIVLLSKEDLKMKRRMRKRHVAGGERIIEEGPERDRSRYEERDGE